MFIVKHVTVFTHQCSVLCLERFALKQPKQRSAYWHSVDATSARRDVAADCVRRW